MPHRRLIVLAGFVSLGFATQTAAAQITTFIPPARKAADSAKATVTAQTKAQTDSIVKMQLTNMKTWVDSAAGIAPMPAAVPDSQRVVVVHSRGVAVPIAETRPAPVMRNGTPAPATASLLPTVALIGAGALLVGVVLLAGPRTARVSARDGA